MIKNIKKLTGNLPKEELKKRILQVVALSLGVMLTASSVPISESYLKYKENKLREEKLEKSVSLLSCRLLVENCSNGTVKHHFVNDNGLFDWISVKSNDKYRIENYEYVSITDDSYVVPYSEIIYNTINYNDYEEIPKIGDYVFDYKIPYYIIDITKLTLPEGYTFDREYNIFELEELEQKLDNSIYQRRQDSSHDIFNLVLLEIDGEYMCFDKRNATKITETSDKEDVTKLRNVYYTRDIVSSSVELKYSKGLNQLEEQIANNKDGFSYLPDYNEEITSLDKNLEFDVQNVKILDIRDYLREYQRTISDTEIIQLVEQLKDLNYQHTL